MVGNAAYCLSAEVTQELFHFPSDAKVKPAEVELQCRIHSTVQLPCITNVQLEGSVQTKPCRGILHKVSCGILMRQVIDAVQNP